MTTTKPLNWGHIRHFAISEAEKLGHSLGKFDSPKDRRHPARFAMCETCLGCCWIALHPVRGMTAGGRLLKFQCGTHEAAGTLPPSAEQVPAGQAGDLAHRWNRAASKFACGSEFVDDPERVFAQVERSIELRVLFATKKSEAELSTTREMLDTERRVRETAERESAQHAERTAQLYIERDTTREIARALAAALERQGYHSAKCSKLFLETDTTNCTCGLDALVAKAKSAGLLDDRSAEATDSSTAEHSRPQSNTNS